MRRDQRAGALDVVVGGQQIIERRVDRAALAAEIEDAAVVAAVEDENLLAPGNRDGGADRHQIGLGAGIGEAHQRDRREAVADRLGEFGFGHAVRAEIDAAVERFVDRLADDGMRVAVEAGGELGEEIGVLMAVSIPQMRALALDHGERKRLGIDRRAGVATGQRLARLFVERRTLRVARAILLLGFLERGGDVDIGGVVNSASVGHRTSFRLPSFYQMASHLISICYRRLLSGGRRPVLLLLRAASQEAEGPLHEAPRRFHPRVSHSRED